MPTFVKAMIPAFNAPSATFKRFNCPLELALGMVIVPETVNVTPEFIYKVLETFVVVPSKFKVVQAASAEIVTVLPFPILTTSPATGYAEALDPL